nr:hypothetical protein [Tanacetum cinerariifolium]
PSGNPTFLSHPELTLPEVKDDIFDPEGGNVLPEKLLDLDSTKDLHPPHHANLLSSSTTYSFSLNQLLEEFADKLALITFPPEYNDDLQFDTESDLKKIEYLLHHDPIKDKDSSLKDSIDQSNLANLNDNLVDSMPKMFTDEHALDYSSSSLFDEYDDDHFEVEVDALPSTNNEDKVFNPGILIQEKLFEIITRVAKDKKLAISHASLMIEDFDPPLYELLFFKKVPRYSWNLKTHAKGFCPSVFTSSASFGNHDNSSPLDVLKINLRISPILTMILLRFMMTLSLLMTSNYEAFYDDHVKEISSGRTTTHYDCSLYD